MTDHDSSTTFSLGEQVFDTEQGHVDGEAYIVEITDESADEVVVDSLADTVAECNPEYPNGDRVIKIVFPGKLSSQEISVMQKNSAIKSNKGQDYGTVFAKNLRQHDATAVYAYPESRLDSY